jgi:cytochrome o ubiquinol oxidase subunit 2
VVKKGIIVGLLLLIVLGVVIGAGFFFQHFNVAVLNPEGEVARHQRDLIVFTTLLGFSVIIPVFGMLGIFAWRFREGNKKAKYRPNWDGNKTLETIWWGIPCVIILVLSVVTWRTSHELDPFKALNSEVKPVNIQVVALQWKWLFIYPDQGVASANFLQIPEKTPVNLTVTADSPMNAIWIPALGGQVYAMSGMSTKLHLMADHTGDFKGSSANVSGKGFADMAFTVRAASKVDFNGWISQIESASTSLDMAAYTKLAQPASLAQPATYVLKDTNLYDKIVMKYMMPTINKDSSNEREPTTHGHSDMTHMPAMEGM